MSVVEIILILFICAIKGGATDTLRNSFEFLSFKNLRVEPEVPLTGAEFNRYVWF